MITLLNLLSALALLVWGTHVVRSDILRVYGAQLRRLLSTSINRRNYAFLAGIGVTSLLQSSNATAVIVCSFVAQGLITLAPALTIMLGADVGTALMTGVLSFDISWLAPLLTFIGVVTYLSRPHTNISHLGRAIIGIGLILTSLQLIEHATRPILDAQGIQVLFSTLTGDILLDALIGALFAMFTYSSLAAVLLSATLAASGVISIEVALCLVIGANLGSGVLALISSAKQNIEGRRVALGSMLFRISGAIIPLCFIPTIEVWMQHVTTDPRHVVIAFHIIYNTIRCLLLLPFVIPMARLCERILPSKEEDDHKIQIKHLDPNAIELPTLALANASRELLRMGDLIENMLNNLLPVIRDNDLAAAQKIRAADDDVDRLYVGIKMYLARVSREELSEKEVQQWTNIITLTINLEQAGDIIQRIAKGVENKKIAKQRSFSTAGIKEITEMHAKLLSSLRLGLSVFLTHDIKSALQLLEEKATFRDLERAFSKSHLRRIASDTKQSIETSSLHLDLISDMKRVHSLFCSPAYEVLDEAGMLRKSRIDTAARHLNEDDA